MTAALERASKRKGGHTASYGSKKTSGRRRENKRRGIGGWKRGIWRCGYSATGGLSYPLTGSDGDGYRMAEAEGHTIKETFPSLVPLTVQEEWCKSLQGLSLKNVRASLFMERKNRFMKVSGKCFLLILE